MKSEKRFLFSEVCFFILFVLVALLLIGSLVAVLLIVFSKPLVENWNCKFLENIANFSPKETAERIDFSIILTSLSLQSGPATSSSYPSTPTPPAVLVENFFMDSRPTMNSYSAPKGSRPSSISILTESVQT